VYERLALRGRLKAEAKYNWQLPESTVHGSCFVFDNVL
jgi:hypothetical protein